MPRKVKELSALAIKNLKAPGMHAVGGVPGLHLQVTSTGAKTWILRYTAGVKPGTGKPWRRDLGLGGYPAVGLAKAREKAQEAREKVAQGIDPITEKREQRSAMIAARLAEITFEQAALTFIDSRGATWKKGSKTYNQWTNSLKEYAFPLIGSLRVSDIERPHVIQVLEPIWYEKNETACRVRMRIENILDWATVREYRHGDNPARWKGYLDKVFPAPDSLRKVQHHAALEAANMPSFMEKLRKVEGVSARALEFIILTATRSNDVRGAKWEEFDLKNAIWTIPGARHKTGNELRVPLSPQALDILNKLPRIDGTDMVFPSPKNHNKGLSDNAPTKTIKDMGYKVTAHGFRSTFRDWCAEHTEFPGEVAEMALSHAIKNKVEAAYRRGDLFDKRRELMETWAAHCDGK